MTTNLKLRIHLNSKIGEKSITFINDVFDLQNGIAFFPIDKETWEVESIDRYVGKHKGKDIFENDRVQCNTIINYVKGKIIYDENCMSVLVDESTNLGYDVGSTPPLYDFISIEKI